MSQELAHSATATLVITGVLHTAAKGDGPDPEIVRFAATLHSNAAAIGVITAAVDSVKGDVVDWSWDDDKHCAAGRCQVTLTIDLADSGSEPVTQTFSLAGETSGQLNRIMRQATNALSDQAFAWVRKSKADNARTRQESLPRMAGQGTAEPRNAGRGSTEFRTGRVNPDSRS